LDIYAEIQQLNQNITGLVTGLVKGVGGDFGTLDTAELEFMGKAEGQFRKFQDIMVSVFIFDIGTYLVSKLLGKLFSKIVGWIFGGGGFIEAVGAGIMILEQSLGMIINDGEVLAKIFADMHKHTEGGVFHSDKDEFWAEYAELDKDAIRLLTKIFKSIGDSFVSLAEGLGVDVQKVYDYILPQMKLDLKGMDTDAINEAVTAFFANLTDTMAEDLFGPIIKQYQQVGEGLYETAVRLVMQKEIFLSVLDMTGKAFEGTAEEAIAMSQAVIEAAGGFEKFAESIESYYDAFFTEAEQLAFLGSSLSESFMELDLVMPGTKQGFRDLIEGIDLTTESGQDLYAALLSIAGASGEYYDALEDAAKQLADAEKSLHETQMESIVRGVVDSMKKSTKLVI